MRFLKLAALLLAIIIVGAVNRGNQTQQLPFLRASALEFAEKYRGQDVLVVSKRDHLLYYLKNGRLVRNDEWNGRNYNFPVKVALASPGYKTPEGEMFIDGKNAQSRYILFLSFSGPGAYGIHSAPTRFRAWLERMEQKFPNFKFATLKDDTRGCVQVENRIIKYLFANVAVNTPVLVMP